MLLYEKLYFSSPNSGDNGEEYCVSILNTANLASNRNDEYWSDGGFLREFLWNSEFDHYHLIEVFKAVLSDPQCRRLIVKSIIEIPFPHVYSDTMEDDLSTQMQSLRRASRVAIENKIRAIATWKYPSVFSPGESENLSHYVTIIVDGIEMVAVILDSRGLDYAKNFHSDWQHAQTILFHTLEVELGLGVVHGNFFDTQQGDIEDQFCQTWSLILLDEFLLPYKQSMVKDTSKISNGCSDQDLVSPSSLVIDNDRPMDHSQFPCRMGPSTQYGVRTNKIEPKHPYERILQFWQRCLLQSKLRSSFYQHVYCQTHSPLTFQPQFHPYFTPLEHKVCGSSEIYYSPNLDEFFFFLEDFLDELINQTGLFENILRECV